jgi:formylglycine-generating enzyme required for sulfatase activity
VPTGDFEMGTTPGSFTSDAPRRSVSITKNFSIGRQEITFAQWEACVADNGCAGYNPADEGWGKGNRPAINISWKDAQRYIEWLSKKTGKRYRLPTEAEWEYACRAGTTTPFHFGKTITTELANYRGTDNESMKWSGSYGDGPKGEHREETTPVNQFEGANAFGLCDMHGNVWEWCQDYWHDSYEGVPTDGSAWIEGGNSERRILRGGSWYDYPRFCRSACRDFNGPGGGDFNIGFRVVCSAPRALQRPTG